MRYFICMCVVTFIFFLIGCAPSEDSRKLNMKIYSYQQEKQYGGVNYVYQSKKWRLQNE
jgi:hypothetical protein